MTVIVGIVDKTTNKVHFGSDRGAMSEDDYYIASQPKIFSIDAGTDHMLLGTAGSWRFGDIIEDADYSDLKITKTNVAKSIRKNLVPLIKKALKENDYDTTEEGNDSCILVGIHGEIFEIQADLSVVAVPARGHAIGAGAVPAIASLICLEKAKAELPIKEMLTIILETTESVSTMVRGPFDYLET